VHEVLLKQIGTSCCKRVFVGRHHLENGLVLVVNFEVSVDVVVFFTHDLQDLNSKVWMEFDIVPRSNDHRLLRTVLVHGLIGGECRHCFVCPDPESKSNQVVILCHNQQF
jgi:hypothetical protein